MLTYTKREIKLLALTLTLFIFLIYNLVFFPLINQIFNQPNYSRIIYSKTIPINENILQYSQNSQELQFKINNYTVNKTIEKQVNKQEETIKQEEINSQQETNKQEEISEQIINNQEINEQSENQINKETQNNIIEANKDITWRIEIPKLNLNVHIMEGTTSNVLLQAVGHFEETSKWQGNVGLAAHNRGYQCNFFAKIKNLEIGDEIIYKTTNGKKVYKVQTNKIIKDTDWSYLQDTQDNRITLITCEENRESYRRCIQAIEIANYKI